MASTSTIVPKVGIIIFSVRTPRVGPLVAQYIKDLIDSDDKATATYSLVDVADFKLPVFDEGILPAMVPEKGAYTKDHTKAWSAEISKYAGFIFVTPEYNYGIPGATKNAIDFLYNEWSTKPALAVSYGIFGGKNASEAMVKTLEGMKVRVVATKPTLGFAGAQGPDLYAAIGGQLGDATKAAWDKEEKSVILEGVKELEEALASPPATEVKN